MQSNANNKPILNLTFGTIQNFFFFQQLVKTSGKRHNNRKNKLEVKIKTPNQFSYPFRMRPALFTKQDKKQQQQLPNLYILRRFCHFKNSYSRYVCVMSEKMPTQSTEWAAFMEINTVWSLDTLNISAVFMSLFLFLLHSPLNVLIKQLLLHDKYSFLRKFFKSFFFHFISFFLA